MTAGAVLPEAVRNEVRIVFKVWIKFAVLAMEYGKDQSAASTLRPARYFGPSVEFRTGIQSRCGAQRVKMDLEDRLEKEVKVREPVA